MSVIELAPSMNKKKCTTITTSELQVDRKQDFILSGKNSLFEWIVVADGHGHNVVIDILKGIEWNEILLFDNPIEEIKKLINVDTHNSGSTISIVKMFLSHIDIFWVGDSTIKIFQDDTLAFESCSHNIDNVHEYKRIKNMDTELVNGWQLKVLDENTITMINSNICIFSNGDRLNMTNALGHNNITGDIVGYKRFNLLDRDYKLIIASDGFWDMMCDNDVDFIKNKKTISSELLSLAKKDGVNLGHTYLTIM